MEPLESSVLAMTLDDGPFEEMSDLEPLTHSVLNVGLDGRPMEGIPDPEPLRAFGSGDGPGRWTHRGDVTFGADRAVLNVALVARPQIWYR